jgi:hypothetical protein
MNKRSGIPYWSYKRGKKYLGDARKHFKTLKKLDKLTTV